MMSYDKYKRGYQPLNDGNQSITYKKQGKTYPMAYPK